MKILLGILITLSFIQNAELEAKTSDEVLSFINRNKAKGLSCTTPDPNSSATFYGKTMIIEIADEETYIFNYDVEGNKWDQARSIEVKASNITFDLRLIIGSKVAESEDAVLDRKSLELKLYDYVNSSDYQQVGTYQCEITSIQNIFSEARYRYSKRIKGNQL